MLSSQHPQKGAPIFVTLTNVASCNVIKPWALNTLGFISPLDINVFPAAETQTSELVMHLCCYYLLVLFLFAGNLIMGQASIAVGCSNADWKMSISVKCFQSKQMDEYQARQTMRLCISAWLPDVPHLSHCWEEEFREGAEGSWWGTFSNAFLGMRGILRRQEIHS